MDIITAPRTIIVTGSNRGIGFEIVKKLYSQAKTFNIIMTSRKRAEAEDKIHALKEENPTVKSQLFLGELDLTDHSGIDKFVEWVKTEFKQVDILVNNAGYGYQLFSPEDGAKTIITNFLGPVELTEKLLPILSHDGKIINISSGNGDLGYQDPSIRDIMNDPFLDSEKLLKIGKELKNDTREKKQPQLCWSDDHYANSKCLINAYTRWALPKLLKGDQTCYACTPGYCATDMVKGKETVRRDKPGPVENGTITPLYLIELPYQKDEDLHGKFFRDCQVESYDKSKK